MFFRRKKELPPLTNKKSLDIFLVTFYNFTGSGKDKVNFSDMFNLYSRSDFFKIKDLTIFVNILMHRWDCLKFDCMDIIGLKLVEGIDNNDK